MEGSLGSKELALGTGDIRGVKRKIGQTDPTIEAGSVSSLCSPASPVSGKLSVFASKMTPSPVKAAEITGSWLRTVISPLPSKPSAKLEQMLVIRGQSIVDEVIRRANIIVTALFPTSRLEQRFVTSLYRINLIESSWSEQRRSQALKLYYRVLEAVCESEARKLNTNDLSGLLANERFHRCLLACSAELVTAAQTGISTLLPVVFERTGITAFDLSKVIGVFIIHEPSLPRELKRHLNSLEEQLLESMVWEKGSSLYDSLIVAKPALSDEIHRLGLLAASMPSIDTIASRYPVSYGGYPYYPTILQNQNLSPGPTVKDRDTASHRKGACSEHGDKALHSISPISPKVDSPPAFCGLQSHPAPTSPSLKITILSPTQSNAQHGGVACSDTAISIIFSKMKKLAAIRIQSIAERLKLSQQFREKIYFLFQQILTQRPCLFFNRHIDQIILCCFYGVAKLSEVELTFKQIIDNYKKQPQCRSKIYLFVSSNHEKSGGQDVGIIAFYNKIFLPSVKSLLDIAVAESPKQAPDTNNTDDFPSLHKMSPFPILPDFSPKKVSPSQNVYLSPLRPSKKDALNSNIMTKSYYALVGGSTQPYESPSKQLSAINKCLNRAPKARCRLKFDNIDAVMISDSVVAESLSLQNN